MHILVADDQSDVRSALQLVLEQEFGVSRVSEAEDAERLIVQLSAIQPDVVLLDWELPDLAPRDTIVQLRDTNPELCVVVLSGRPEARRPALDAGADAFVSKIDSPDRLLKTLRKIGVLNGDLRDDL